MGDFLMKKYVNECFSLRKFLDFKPRRSLKTLSFLDKENDERLLFSYDFENENELSENFKNLFLIFLKSVNVE